MNSCFPILVTAEYICEILKTLNLAYIENEFYRKPSDNTDRKNFFYSWSKEKEIIKSVSGKGNFIFFYCKLLIINAYLKKLSPK